MENIITVENVSKAFTNHVALDDVSLEVPRGKVYGLLGPNGAGKTTLIRIINHITAPDKGRVIFDGHDLTAADIVMITGCASSSYSNPVSISGSYTMHPLELVVVDIRIVFDTDRPAQATAANIYNYSRRQGLGSDTVEGVNVWRIDLLNATQY